MFYCQTTSTVNTFGRVVIFEKIKCVRRACPRRDLHIMISSFLVCCSKRTLQFLRSGTISNNLFGEDWLHLFCHKFVRCLFMLDFKYLKNFGSSEVLRFTASFARSSTCSLPGMPIWPGTQQKKILSSRWTVILVSQERISPTKRWSGWGFFKACIAERVRQNYELFFGSAFNEFQC